jgi:anhydro-N-acetylmuramic acid kinase
MQISNTIGLMSGTSLDGLDIVYVEISYNSNWSYKIKEAQTIKYSNKWIKKLTVANQLNGFELIKIHKEYGILLAQIINKFITDRQIPKNDIDVISSHGHTVFHQPNKRFSYQIGCGIEISSKTNIKTICDFRSLDIAHGGEGAPLVPIGDLHLFKDYKYCLNIGGIANISYTNNSKRIAGDIDFANINSNRLANQLDLSMDRDGELAKKGSLNIELLNKLNEITFYKKNFPRSLGIEDYHKWYKPVLDDFNIPIQDQLHTTGIHLCNNIFKLIEKDDFNEILITGGGAHNKFWIHSLNKMGINIKLPSKEIIEFKEALIFAFLGVLYLNNEVNTLASVTGASKNLKSGTLYDPKNF